MVIMDSTRWRLKGSDYGAIAAAILAPVLRVADCRQPNVLLKGGS